MAKLYKYQKITDQFTTHCLAEPDYDRDGGEGITELCTIDGETYVSVPDGITLPLQPDQITVGAMELTDELSEAIKAASPHVALINERVVERIRARYSVNDEIKMLRIGPSLETSAYNDFAEECRDWGRAEKERLMGPDRRDNIQTDNFKAVKADNVRRLLKKGLIAEAITEKGGL